MLRRPLVFLALLCLTLVSPASVRAWWWIDAGLQPVAFPAGALPVSPSTGADLDGDGQPETLQLLAGSRAAIFSGIRMRWQSPDGWQVRQALIADLNHDGRPEAVLLVWRPFRPWPVDAWLPSGGRIAGFHDAAGLSCQIILIGWYQGAFRERWAGSALAEPVAALAAVDLAGNGRQLLVTLESEYDDPSSAPARRLKIWDWDGFGFSLVYRLDGPFDQMHFVRTHDGRLVLLLS